MSRRADTANHDARTRVRLAKARRTRNEVETAYTADGTMNSKRLNQLFAPAMINAGAVWSGAGWVLRGEILSTTLYLQRSQWANAWHTILGAFRSQDGPRRSIEVGLFERFAWSYRITDGTITNLKGHQSDLLDFEEELIYQEARLKQIAIYAERTADMLHSLQEPPTLYAQMLLRNSTPHLDEFKTWLQTHHSAQMNEQ